MLNYYKLPISKLNQKINEIKWWLFNYRNNNLYSKVEFALLVALNAKKIRKNNDEFITLLIDFLT